MRTMLWLCLWLFLSFLIAWSYRQIPFIMLAVLLIAMVLLLPVHEVVTAACLATRQYRTGQ
jgi:CHASE2 domain-containing sensor protein